MLFHLVISRRSASIPQLLLRHYSIRVSPLKKHSLFSQILRHGASPTPKRYGGHKAIPPQNSVRSVEKKLPPSVSSKLSVFENVEGRDLCPREEKVSSDGSVESKADGEKDHYSDNGFTAGTLEEGPPTLCRHDGELPFMRSRKVKDGGKHSDADAHKGKTFSSVRYEIPETEGHHRESKRTRSKASKVDSSKSYITGDNSMETLLRVGSSQKQVYSAPDFGDECWKYTNHGVCTTASKEITPAQALVLQNVCVPCEGQMKEREGVLSTEFMKGFSSIIMQKTKEFRESLEAKINLLHFASVPPATVKELLEQPRFVSASPAELAIVFKSLTELFESSEMAFKTFAKSPEIYLQFFAEDRAQSMDGLPVDFGNGMADVDDRKRILVQIFLMELGLSANSARNMICRCPLILRQSIDEALGPIVAFLKSLGISKPSLIRLLKRRPFLLSLSLESELLPLHATFKKFGLSDKTFLLSLSINAFHDRKRVLAQYLLLLELGFSAEAIPVMIEKDPRILMLQRERMEVHLDYLLHSAKWDISEIVAFPSCFNYSLKGRIIPRMKLVEKLGKPMSLSHRTVLAQSNSRFCAWYKSQS